MKLVALMSTLRRGACAVAIRPGLLVMIEHGDKVLPLRSSGRPLPATIHAWLHTSTQEAPAGSCRLHTLLQRRRRRAGIGLSTSLSTTARPAHRSHAARGAWRWQGCAQSEHTRAPPGREPGTGCFVSGRWPARV